MTVAYARRVVKLEREERLALGYQFRIAASREQAAREAAPHYKENMKMFGELRLERDLAKSNRSRRPRESGGPGQATRRSPLGSRLRGNDGSV